MKLMHLIRQLIMGVSVFCVITAAQSASPLWSFTPDPNYPPQVSINSTQTATVKYTVRNQSRKAKLLVVKAIPGIVQTKPCQVAPKGQAGSSCTLNLAITGSALPKGGVHGGPTLCQASPDGSPNSNQCYQPSNANSLNITRVPTTGATIMVNPSNLNFAAGSNGLVTVTNSIASTELADNVVSTIPGGSNISVQSTTCGASLAIGASCTITFTGSAAEGPTNIVISGSNTNTTNVAVTVTAVPIATISVNPKTLMFTENSTGNVTVTNAAGSSVSANNVVATIPGGSNISVQSTTCGASLAIGASCSITFASSTQEGPTTIPIKGDNTNTVNVSVRVTSKPQISISGPVQERRVVPTSGVPLSLQVTNDLASVVNANGITVSNKTACPNLSVNDANCASVPPGGSCTLELSSTTPYAPCTITISGINTGNSPTTLIAYSHLGGLVFQKSGINGKVVIDAGSEFISEWTFPSKSDIPGAVSDDDGVSNTNAIVIHLACTDQSSNCAAYRCRTISPNWYLPAKNELQAVIFALCPGPSYPCAFGTFSSTFYWSSTQWSVGTTNAYRVDVPDGNFGPTDKYSSSPVRCIRDF